MLAELPKDGKGDPLHRSSQRRTSHFVVELGKTAQQVQTTEELGGFLIVETGTCRQEMSTVV